MLTALQIKNLTEALRNDEIVVMPTDTIHGFSAKNSSRNQVRLNRFKKAPLNKPLIVLISNEQQLSTLVNFNHYAPHLELLHQGITVVFPHRKEESQTIAVRWVKRPDLVEVIETIGPLWSTSVNYHQQEQIGDPKLLQNTFPNIKIFIDHNLSQGKASKIYDTLHHKWLR